METLSLPPFDYKVKKQSGICLIFDIIRKKYVVLTPEEWVRQHVIHYLIGHKGYAPAAIAVERAVDLYGMSRRFDIVAFGKDGAPRLLIECKAPSVPLTRQVSSSSTTSPPPADPLPWMLFISRNCLKCGVRVACPKGLQYKWSGTFRLCGK